jgi:hypothetical protein
MSHPFDVKEAPLNLNHVQGGKWTSSNAEEVKPQCLGRYEQVNKSIIDKIPD